MTEAPRLRLPLRRAGQRRFFGRLQHLLPGLESLVASAGEKAPSLHIGQRELCVVYEEQEIAGEAVLIADACRAKPIALTEITARLGGHLGALDHVGINIPAGSCGDWRWESWRDELAARCELYQFPFPGVNDIYFFLPGAGDGNGSPLMELVYDRVLSDPTLHFNVHTKLDKADLVALFPEGVFKPGDEDYFLSVAIDSPWSGLVVYFDFSFAREEVTPLVDMVRQFGARVSVPEYQ